MTYCESVTRRMRHGALNARRPSMAAVNSMRLEVVSGWLPTSSFSRPLLRRMHAQTPGPGLPIMWDRGVQNATNRRVWRNLQESFGVELFTRLDTEGSSPPASERRLTRILPGTPSQSSSFVPHHSLAYSALACLRMGMSESASFQRVRKSW